MHLYEYNTCEYVICLCKVRYVPVHVHILVTQIHDCLVVLHLIYLYSGTLVESSVNRLDGFDIGLWCHPSPEETPAIAIAWREFFISGARVECKLHPGHSPSIIRREPDLGGVDFSLYMAGRNTLERIS